MKKDFTISSWLWKKNFIPLLELLSSLSKLEFDKDNLDEILYKLSLTNDELGNYGEYSIGKEIKMTIQFALDANDSEIIHYHLKSDPGLDRELNLLASILDEYYLTK